MGVFSYFNDRRKTNTDDIPTVEGHYTKLGRRTAFVRYACILLLVVFAVYSLIMHRDEISIENFRYMMKFINIGEDAEKPIGSVITFDGSDGNRGLIYKGDLAVLNESGVTVTAWDGDVTLKEQFSFDHPKMVQNGINLFCYDLGGRGLKVFNSYTELETKISFDYPLYWLSASASGSFAVVSSAKGYRSAVYVYDRDFRPAYSCLFGNKYIDFVDISPAGDEIVIAGHYSSGGDILTVVARYSTGSEKPVSELSFIGEIPLGIYYTESGYALLTSEALRTFARSDDSTVGTIPFSGRSPVSARMYGDRALVTYGTEGLSGGTELVVYGFDCAPVLTYSFPTSLTATILCGEKAFALSPGSLTGLALSGGEVVSYEIPTSFSSLLADGDRLVLFSDGEARYFAGEDLNDRTENDIPQ